MVDSTTQTAPAPECQRRLPPLLGCFERLHARQVRRQIMRDVGADALSLAEEAFARIA
jgi:hypothetical protein